MIIWNKKRYSKYNSLTRNFEKFCAFKKCLASLDWPYAKVDLFFFGAPNAR